MGHRALCKGVGRQGERGEQKEQRGPELRLACVSLFQSFIVSGPKGRACVWAGAKGPTARPTQIPSCDVQGLWPYAFPRSEHFGIDF